MENQTQSIESVEREEKKWVSRRKPYKTIPPEVIPQYKKTLFSYQRIINNLIGAIGIIKSPHTYYPYINYKKSGTIYMQFDEKKLTSIDIKTIDIERIQEKIEEFIVSLENPWLQQIFGKITEDIQYDILNYFSEQRKIEEGKGVRHRSILRFGKTKDRNTNAIMQSLYNTMGRLRMQLFDYDPTTKTVFLNQEGKSRLLTQLYNEVDEINKITDVFPGADYPTIKTKQMTINDITEEEITKIVRYLLLGHHTIDDMTNLHKKINTKETRDIAAIKEPLKNLLNRGIKKWSKNSKISPITDPRINKHISSKLKLSRWWFLQRISIAAPYLYNKYDFEAIAAIEKTAVAQLEEKLYQEYPDHIKHIKVRVKNIHSAIDKILREKETTEYRDGIGLQIFVDFTWVWAQQKEKIIQEIFHTVNTSLHNYTVPNIWTIHIDSIELDNKNMIKEAASIHRLTEALSTPTYKVKIREKHKKKRKIQDAKSRQDYIIAFIQGWKSWSNGERSDIKEIKKIHTYTDNDRNNKIWGIETQIVEYGKSINKGAGWHNFLQAEKKIVGTINTNKTSPWQLYCDKKDIAICTTAEDLRNKDKNIQAWEEKEYTQQMYEKEKYYTIAIDDKNKDFMEQTKDKWDPTILREEWGRIIIDLTQLNELSSHIAKRHAADLIIMEQANDELRRGKIVQYYYDSDENFNNKKKEKWSKNKNERERYHEVSYPWIRQIKRDEIGQTEPISMKFIDSESLISIETWQIPQNASIIIPQKDDPNKGYIQSISELAYALKEDDIRIEPKPIKLTEELAENLTAIENN